MITLDQARDFIYEYKWFIVMQGLANTYLYPSEAVDKIWQIHMAHGKNYVEFCMKVCKRVFYHGVYTGDTTGGED